MVQSVARALRILELLDQADEPEKGIGPMVISRDMDVKFPTVHNLLQTLVKLGYVEPLSGGKYRLATKSLELGWDYRNRKSLLHVAIPLMEDLNERLHETINVTWYSKGKRHILHEIGSPHTLNVTNPLTVSSYLYIRASDRVVLSNMHDDELESYVKEHGLPYEEWDNITSLHKLKDKLHDIREQGYAIVHNVQQQVTGFGVSMADEELRLNSALGAYMPTVRFNDDAKRGIIKGLQETAKAILARLNA